MIGGEPPSSKRMPTNCRCCAHFDADAARIEAALPGLSALGSAYATVRSNDGLCRLHDRYVAATSACSAATYVA
jgi:hypothetical protein